MTKDKLTTLWGMVSLVLLIFSLPQEHKCHQNRSTYGNGGGEPGIGYGQPRGIHAVEAEDHGGDGHDDRNDRQP